MKILTQLPHESSRFMKLYNTDTQWLHHVIAGTANSSEEMQGCKYQSMTGKYKKDMFRSQAKMIEISSPGAGI